MRVAMTGANSAVGRAILRCGMGERTKQGAESITFVAAVRSERAAEDVRPLLGKSDTVARISYDNATSLRTAFKDASAVIHLAGILIEGRDSTYEQANVSTTRAVVEAAKQSGVKKIVLVSATGASEASSNRYWKSKAQAEALVRDSGLSYTVLRVPLLLGTGTEGSAALKRNASGRKAKLLGGGRSLQQPLCVDDLARAAILAAQPSVAKNRTLELVGPVSLPESELVKRASRQMGHEVRIGSIPKKLTRCALAIRQLVAGPGFSPDALDVITADTRLDPLPAAKELGIELTGIEEMIKSSIH
jgi:uncharacterized protein YbjT (DUF2867 family)